MKNKNIWIINEYAGSPNHGMEFRHYYLAKNFIDLGYNVTIISASFSHLFKINPTISNDYQQENIDGINYLWIKVPKYKGSKDKIRVLKWFLYCLKLYFLPIKKMSIPDSIIMSSAAPFSIFPARYLKNKFKAKLVFEVKDIWPLSLIYLGNFSENHPFIKLMSYSEKKAINSCDYLVSNLPNYQQHIKNLNIDKKVYWMPNGIQLSNCSPIQALNNSFDDKLPEDKFIVGYAGTIGTANALNYLLESALLLRDNKDIFFVLVGGGNEKQNLVDYVDNNDLQNILFIDPIKKDEIPDMLTKFNIGFVGSNDEPLYEFGIAANKIFDYMLASLPILLSFSGKGNPVLDSNCGITVEAGSAEKITKAILEYSSMTKIDLTLLGENGKKHVLENFTYTKIAEKYIELLK